MRTWRIQAWLQSGLQIGLQGWPQWVLGGSQARRGFRPPLGLLKLPLPPWMAPWRGLWRQHVESQLPTGKKRTRGLAKKKKRVTLYWPRDEGRTCFCKVISSEARNSWVLAGQYCLLRAMHWRAKSRVLGWLSPSRALIVARIESVKASKSSAAPTLPRPRLMYSVHLEGGGDWNS